MIVIVKICLVRILNVLHCIFYDCSTRVLLAALLLCRRMRRLRGSTLFQALRELRLTLLELIVHKLFSLFRYASHMVRFFHTIVDICIVIDSYSDAYPRNNIVAVDLSTLRSVCNADLLICWSDKIHLFGPLPCPIHLCIRFFLYGPPKPRVMVNVFPLSLQ